ncbi:Methyl-accepting chemotaxis protein [Candidatus Nitrotoga sp. HW29]|uniref:methyl-accepting chemotaxis protein n=1 Tax=Candidatus Nitrotoga sp. HW29 TaxID=2886963 RepID=UPI001EF1F2A4|nr:methyl-accepting chemotaxis protein [Candidatus Nitrotoga sp. HW29]CAH1904230.1 Methyl-accepting chemotaxis protein [Candidatus Nitrotoga sp. HW29]
MFNNMKIGMRLGFGFGVVVFLLIAVAALAVSRLSQQNDMLNVVVNDRYSKMTIVTEIKQETTAIAIALRNMMLTDSPADMKKQEEKIIESKNKVSEGIDKLQKIVVLPKGKELLRQVLDNRTKYIDGYKNLINIINEGKKDEARLYLTNVLRPILVAYQASLNTFTDLQKELVQAALKEAADSYNMARNVMLALVGIALVLAAGIGFWVTRSITKPLNIAVNASNRLAEGDLTTRIEVTSKDETGQLLVAMQNMVGKLSQVVTEVRSASDSLSSASEEVSATAQSMSQATSEQAASVEETSASIEQMSASINQNTENAKVTDGMASKAAKEATEGGESVQQTVSAMKEIAQKISIIDDIAYQTNLLALNAAIEAARAGEHGKGFAVVAAEVRKLAERSQVAAQEIGQLASSSVGMAEKAGKLLDEMVPSINKTSDLVQEISAASEEQSAGVSQINTAMSQLSQITQQNASASEELAATAEEMSGQAEQLQQTMGFFKVDNTVGNQQRQAAVSKVAASNSKAMRPATKAKSAMHALAGIPNEAEFARF